ncbi:MATE family efflux transporter [Brachyspira hampsonii]|uniref:Multidrug-efflux transporter n=1 Tax=Brachyspira hampsonii TaxID=1287055 RepID=A0AAC9TUZ8_9SPIR|nr:MATE family efflux transporter [Brachyspira hampsonii]ASJ22780.1 MATE family efflux transporter [Brachyspira hampsonii]MBW5379177.1 MATE family efflux transporter [Brachyspira hampsonii]MBW5410003.1 MATE family efflux transporter [Brachyspira hampsonii]OEJ18758.1 MATE family efflux transporter [Brachyspira hampsonii]
MKKEKYELDLTECNVAKGLLILVIPMVLGNLLNVAYSTVDAIWIGQIVGSKGLAAVAVSFPLTMVVTAIASGISTAVNVLIGQYFGANDKEYVTYISKVSTTVSLITSLTLAILGYVFAPNLMVFLNTSESIMEDAVNYFRISMIGFPFVFYYTFISALLRGIGDTVRPLIFLIISSVINIILDPLMIKGIYPFPAMGVSGAAYATVFAQAVSVIVSMIYLKAKNSIIRVNPINFKFDLNITKLILKIGLPFTFMQLISSISWLFLNKVINSYGELSSAAFAVAARIDALSFVPLSAILSGIGTMAAQNIGANKMYRIKEIFSTGLKVSLTIALIMTALCMLFPDFIIKIFVQDDNIMPYMKSYIYAGVPSTILVAVIFSANGIINASGKTFIIMMFTLFTHFLIRIPVVYLLSPKIGLWGVWISMSVSNLFNMIFHLVYYYSNKWKKNANITLNSYSKDDNENKIIN